MMFSSMASRFLMRWKSLCLTVGRGLGRVWDTVISHAGFSSISEHATMMRHSTFIRMGHIAFDYELANHLILRSAYLLTCSLYSRKGTNVRPASQPGSQPFSSQPCSTTMCSSTCWHLVIFHPLACVADKNACT